MTATIALISGAPGSGKTTLAVALAKQLGWARVNRDDLYARLMASQGVSRDEVVPQGIPLFWTSTAALARGDQNVIADATLYRGQSEKDVLEILAPAGRLLNVHCRSRKAFERFLTRGHDKATNERVLANEPLVTDALSLGCPRLDVDTTNGYVPSLDGVRTWLSL